MQFLQNFYNMVTHYSQEIAAVLQVIAAATATIIGGYNGDIQVLIIVMFLDYIAGIIRAGSNGVLNSKAGWLGIMKKASYFVIIALFFQIGQWIGSNPGQAIFVRGMVVNLLIINEAVSVLENIRHVGDENYLPHGIVELLEGLIAEDVREKIKMGELPGDSKN